MKKLKRHFDFNRANRNGVLLLLIILLLVQIGVVCYEPFIDESNTTKDQQAQIEFLQKELENTTESKIVYKKIDPNHLNEKEWISLGFSKKQTEIILKYKKSLGSFSNLEEIRSCYVISDEKFKELEPFLFFESDLQRENHKNRKELALNYFDPNKLNEKGWIALGFSEKQAKVILKYKTSLGGIFKTKEELKKCFVISDVVFERIEPWIVFNEQEKITKEHNKDLNHCDVKVLIDWGIAPKEAQRIINYRKALGGFCHWNQLKEISVYSQKMKELADEFILISSLKKLNVNEEELYILKKHPYITQDFVNFLKSSRENRIKFSSFQEIENQYKKEELNKLLEQYLSY